MSLGPAWCARWILGQLALCRKRPCFKTNKNNKHMYWLTDRETLSQCFCLQWGTASWWGVCDTAESTEISPFKRDITNGQITSQILHIWTLLHGKTKFSTHEPYGEGRSIFLPNSIYNSATITAYLTRARWILQASENTPLYYLNQAHQLYYSLLCSKGNTGCKKYDNLISESMYIPREGPEKAWGTIEKLLSATCI